MKKIFFVFGLILLTSLAFVLGSKFTQASEIGRAYFRIKNQEGLVKVAPYVHHDFGDGVFSIEAPKLIIAALSKSSVLEFRGEASLWEISSHREISATCSPSASIPWGVAKVRGGTGGGGVKVAVVDTGVKSDHPDLQLNIVDCKDTQSTLIRSRCKDGNGHGTHVAGTILANGKIKGVAPDAKLMAIKVCSDNGFCWSDDVARGIRYAADNGANIISISLGGSSLALDEQLALDYAIDTKGALVVAAAGNSGPNDNSIGYPAAYYKVVAVGATNSSDSIASFSSRGNNYATSAYSVEERDIEFAAPGVAVESTYKDGCYKVYSGTSMATPHVSGLAAKVWQGSASSTRSFLQNRAKNFYADIGRIGDDPDAGFGLPTSP
ncbi:MAG: S8 family serine peptidase [Patescibacteria group bacterium]